MLAGYADYAGRLCWLDMLPVISVLLANMAGYASYVGYAGWLSLLCWFVKISVLAGIDSRIC